MVAAGVACTREEPAPISVGAQAMQVEVFHALPQSILLNAGLVY
jgi:hypothetical protein